MHSRVNFAFYQNIAQYRAQPQFQEQIILLRTLLNIYTKLFFAFASGPHSCLHLIWWIIPLSFALFVSWRCYWLGIGPLGLSEFYTSLGIIFMKLFFLVFFCSTAFSSCPSTFLPKAGNKWDETVNAPLLTLVFLLAFILNISSSSHLTATPQLPILPSTCLC